ncbi:protein virilizer homolog isoform X3 [Convolutriloba macropyga]|uniref:protein virilizer homolog isoform X3 n=1 Tax=Convolutriloba macropyga TaxID=536237 RepID=UPI003F51FDD2
MYAGNTMNTHHPPPHFSQLSNFNQDSNVLLFADTFDHNEDNYPLTENCDVIQFSYPVSISRVTVVPPNVKFEVNSNSILVGLTKPNNFKLETFINNLTAPGSKSSSFSKFCDVNYDDAFHNHTTVPASPSAQTDVLVIKGRYKVCSVCVYGTIQQYKLPSDPQEKVPHLTDAVIPARSLSASNVGGKLVSPIPTSLQIPASIASAAVPKSEPVNTNDVPNEAFFGSQMSLPNTNQAPPPISALMDPNALPGAIPFTQPRDRSAESPKDSTDPVIQKLEAKNSAQNNDQQSSTPVTPPEDESKKWLDAANLFIQQTAEAAAATMNQQHNPVKQSPPSPTPMPESEKSPSPGNRSRTIELMTGRERSLSKESANAPLPEVAPDGPKPNVSSQPPSAPNPLPGAGLPPGMLAALPPGLNPAAMAAMAASGLPFPVPPFNMAMPPFFNPGALNEMAKLYGNPMLNPAAAPVSVAGAPPGMGGIVPPGVAAGLTGPRFIQPPGLNKPQPESHGGMNGGGIDVGVGFSHPISGNMGMQVPVLNSASSADEDYDDLSADDYFDDDYEDASDDDNLSEEQSQQQAIENQKFQEQQSLLEQKEDQLIRHVLGRFEDEKAEPIRSLSQIRGVLEMKHFKSPHLYIAERVDKSMFDENKHKQLSSVVGEIQKEKELDERWVERLEVLYEACLQALSQLKHHHAELFKQLLHLITGNACLAVEWERALSQKVGVNVRQIKVGCRLISLLAIVDGECVKQLLSSQVLDSLFNLVCQPLMVSTMRLFALEAIDALCCSSLGLKTLLATDGFAKLLEILNTSKCLRINHAISVIAHKINIFECLQSCHKQTLEVSRKIRNCSDSMSMEAEAVSNAFAALMEAIEGYPKNQIRVPPGIKKFEPRQYEAFIFRLMNEKGLIDQIQLLLASPLNQSSNMIAASLMKLLQWFIASNEGRAFLVWNLEAVKGCVECLSCDTGEDDLENEKQRVLAMQLTSAVKTHEAVDELRTFGVKEESNLDKMRVCLERIYFLIREDAETVTLILRQTDSLKFLCHFLLTHMRQKAADSAKKSNSAEGQTNLRTLTNGSRQSGDDKEGGSEVDSVVFFVISVLQRAAETEVSHVESWALVLLQLHEIEDATPILGTNESMNSNDALKSCLSGVSVRKMREFCKWLEPIRDLKVAVENNVLSKTSKGEENARELKQIGAEHIEYLVYYMKHRLEEFGGRFVLEAPGMITCLRMLQRLLSQPMSSSVKGEANLIACLNLFEASGYDILLRLTKSAVVDTSSFLSRSHQLNSRLPENILTACIDFALPLLEVLKFLIGQLTATNEIQFRDMRVVEAVVTLHAVVSSKVNGRDLVMKMKGAKIRSLTVDVLLMYTKESTAVMRGEGEENKSRLGNTGWSLMVKTLLEHMTALPNSVLSGLALLSELIPLPLPIMCPSLPVKDGELRFIRENRARWGVSVMPHCKMLSQMLSVLMNSASSQLSTVVKRIACQIADLSPELSKTIIHCFVDRFLDLNGKAPANQFADKKWTYQIRQVLSFIDHAVSQPAGKAAFIQMLSGEEEEFETMKISQCLEQMLMFLDIDSADEDAAQFTDVQNEINYYVITIMQSLCDPSVSLITFDHSQSFIPDDVIETNTPPSKIGRIICEEIFKHASNRSQSMFTFHHAMKALVLLCCHDHVFAIVRYYLLGNPDTLKKLLTKLHREQKSQREEVNVKSFLSFLNLLRGSTASEDFLGSNRSLFLTHEEMSILIGTGSNGEYSLEKYPEKIQREGTSLSGSTEDALRSLLTYLSNPSKTELSNASGADVSTATAGPNVSPRMSLQTQFDNRCLFRLSPIQDERFSPLNWFPSISTAIDDVNKEHLVPINLSESCKDALRDFDPVAEFKKEREIEIAKINKKYKHRRRYDPLVARGFKSKKLVRRPNYLAKEKGVDFGPKRTDDVFRMRKQNTSRPPSMHVDDFMLLEKAENNEGARRTKVRTIMSSDGPRGGYNKRIQSVVPGAAHFTSSHPMAGVKAVVDGSGGNPNQSSERGVSLEANLTKKYNEWVTKVSSFYSAARGWIGPSAVQTTKIISQTFANE